MTGIKIFEPRYLYRYRSLNSDDLLARELGSIQDGYLWCSNFEELNDPMEGSYRQTLRLRRNPRSADIREKIFGQKAALGICSFSETNDNSLMWAHYAEKFCGICIEYKFAQLRESLGDGACFVRLGYSEQPCRVSSNALSEPDTAMKILSTKSHRWLYEREWRLFCSRTGRQPISQDSISRVFLGSKMNSRVRSRVTQHLTGAGIGHMAMKIDGYEITFSGPGKKRQAKTK